MFGHISRATFLIMMLGLAVAGCSAVQSSAAFVPTTAPTAPSAAPSATVSVSTPATSSPSSSADSNLVRLAIVPQQSEARYRVREQLAGVDLPSDAIGRTKEITGTMIGKTDGTIVSGDSKFVVDLRTLQSDRSQRDNFLRRNVLETDQYPYATFVPTQAPGLPAAVPASGQATFKLIGNLTVRDVTKPVTWDVTCKAQGNTGNCQATTTFTFEYMGLTQPRVPVVLSVENKITLELDAVLERVVP